MALLVDGELNRIEDLRAQDSGVLDVAAGEGIDLEEKLELAWKEVLAEVEYFLAQEGGARLEQVAVSLACQSFHARKTLEAVYRDAFFSQLNDRYGQRWRHWVSLAEKQRVRLFELGVKVVRNPVRRPEGLEVELTEGVQPAGSYWVQATQVDESGRESAPSRVRALGAIGPHGLTVRVSGELKWNVYVGAAPERMGLQNEEPLEAGEAWVMPEGGLVEGRTAGTGQAPDGMVRREPRNWRG